jgi:hypothetical protein
LPPVVPSRTSGATDGIVDKPCVADLGCAANAFLTVVLVAKQTPKTMQPAARVCDKCHAAFANESQTCPRCHATTSTEWAPAKPRPAELDNSKPMAPYLGLLILITIGTSACALTVWMLAES